MEYSSAVALRSHAEAAATVLIGYSAPVYALPIFSGKHPEARCAYCLLVLVVWTLMRVLPAPVACVFPPLVLAASNTISDDDAIAGYTSPYVLHVVAVMLVIRLCRSLSLFDRAAVVVIRHKGTRVRSLMLAFSALSLLATLFLDNGVTTLLMAALIERAAKALQDNTIQAYQKRALFNKATRGFSRHRRKTFEDLLMRDAEQTEATAHQQSQALQQHDQPCSPAPSAERSKDEDVAVWEACEQHPAKYSPSLASSMKETRKPSLASNLKFRLHDSCVPRRISIMERGHVVLPGISSPTPPRARGIGNSANLSRRMTLMSTAAMDSIGLKEIASWETERYTSLQRDLLLGAVMVTVIGSIVTPRGNTANVFLFSYLQMRFSNFVLHITSWVMIIFPVVGCALLACLSVIYFVLVRQYDAEEDENARLEILKVIEKQSEDLGALTDQQTLVLDYLLVALLSSVAAQWPAGRTEEGAAAASPPCAVDWRALVPHILWGPLVIHGSVSCIGPALQVSGAAYWIQALLNEFNLFPPTTIQIVLAVLSSVLTEFISIDVTVATLLPIVVDLALKIPCNPLYFAIPVAVASSTTLVLPTAAMSIAILDDVLTPSRRKMLIHGTVVKLVTVTSLIFSMNTVGEMLFSWSELPSWAQQRPAPNASSTAAIQRLLRGL
ncbi:solute carrier family 13 member 4-like isoform X2 [Dermacentor albipictus]|uniref:solute carrier family 13 member 4-like isoform X2 n=1 Tax=Dermacentor albipictus TaxID=60249 RepID=UPI0038FC3F7F